MCARDIRETCLEEPVEVYPFRIECASEVVYRILDRIVFCHKVDEPAKRVSGHHKSGGRTY